MSTDPDYTIGGPDINGLFDALEAIDAVRTVDFDEETDDHEPPRPTPPQQA